MDDPAMKDLRALLDEDAPLSAIERLLIILDEKDLLESAGAREDLTTVRDWIDASRARIEARSHK